MSEIPRTGGSILSVMEEIVKGEGYNYAGIIWNGCANDITKIIESQGGYGILLKCLLGTMIQMLYAKLVWTSVEVTESRRSERSIPLSVALERLSEDIESPNKRYKISDIKAEMKINDGEVKLIIPKFRREEKVFNVNINPIPEDEN
ncbi:hypothetical protein Tco_0485429 [Tanacetum coccineum]